MILSRNLKRFSGATRKTGSTSSDSFDGTINSTNQLIESEKGYVLATLSVDVINSSFLDDNGSTVTVKGKRTY